MWDNNALWSVITRHQLSTGPLFDFHTKFNLRPVFLSTRLKWRVAYQFPPMTFFISISKPLRQAAFEAKKARSWCTRLSKKFGENLDPVIGRSNVKAIMQGMNHNPSSAQRVLRCLRNWQSSSHRPIMCLYADKLFFEILPRRYSNVERCTPQSVERSRVGPKNDRISMQPCSLISWHWPPTNHAASNLRPIFSAIPR